MTWYYKYRGEHVHVRVYCNSALCGTLIFRISEFENIRENNTNLITFQKDL